MAAMQGNGRHAGPLAHGSVSVGFGLRTANLKRGSRRIGQAGALPTIRPMESVWPWLAVALAALVAGAALALQQARRQRELEAALRQARDWQRCLDDLLEVGTWRTDRRHRLLHWHLPAAGVAPLADAALWEAVAAGDEAALRDRLERQAPLDDLEVAARPAGIGSTPSWRGRLRGRVRTDATGAFDGYHGTLVLQPVAAPTPAAPPADAEQESFTTIISHDLRAPIRVVEGFTRILKEDYGRALDRIGNDHLDRVLGAAARMNSMIDALLALARLSSQPLARQPVDLSQLAAYVAEDLRRQAPERAVQLHIEPGLQVLGDPTLLRLVVENLLGNAWKYTAKCRAPEVWFERRAGSSDTFSVRDNGAGFDMRFADRLFGVFQRLHSASDFQGTGVGLASVRRIVRRHGGEIWAEAEVDRGARFHFSLKSPAP
jgi:signal transduction histidine kinase